MPAKPDSVEIELGHGIVLLADRFEWDGDTLVDIYALTFMLPGPKGPYYMGWPRSLPIPESVLETVRESEA